MSSVYNCAMRAFQASTRSVACSNACFDRASSSSRVATFWSGNSPTTTRIACARAASAAARAASVASAPTASVAEGRTKDHAAFGGASTNFEASGVERPTGHRSVVPSLEPVGDVDAARGCGHARRSPGLADPDDSESPVGGQESFCRALRRRDSSLSLESFLSFDSFLSTASR